MKSEVFRGVQVSLGTPTEHKSAMLVVAGMLLAVRTLLDLRFWIPFTSVSNPQTHPNQPPEACPLCLRAPCCALLLLHSSYAAYVLQMS